MRFLEGFPPTMCVYFYSHRMEQGECRTSPCPPIPATWAPTRVPCKDKGQCCTLCTRLMVAQNSYSALTELNKMARIQAGNCVANTWWFPMEEASTSQRGCISCSSKGCAVHCSSQPHCMGVSSTPFPCTT